MGERDRDWGREQVERFVRSFEPCYRWLAYHAALPLVLTPELTHYLRNYFLRGEGVPWIAEVDLLLSDLCRPVGYEQYAMEPSARAYLLESMEAEEIGIGKRQMEEVARFLVVYLEGLLRRNPSFMAQRELKAQRWSAMVYLDDRREEAVREIAIAYEGATVGERSELARLSAIVRELAPRLKEHSSLVEYAKLIRELLANPEQGDRAVLERSFAVAEGVELRVPGGLLPKVAETKAEEADNFPPLKTFEFEMAKIESEWETDKHKLRRWRREGVQFVEDLGNGIGLEMVSVPGGKFQMGSPRDESERHPDEGPQHEVTVAAFYLGKYPVTQAQWRAIAILPKANRELALDPARFKGKDYPIETVSWDDAIEFCQRLSRVTGREYRLPSEAEWEYACRAEMMTPFSFGETISTDLANYDGNFTYGDGIKGEYQKKTTPVGNFSANGAGLYDMHGKVWKWYNRKKTMPVGSFPANGFGLYDMHGNVWEWCIDVWHGNYKKAPANGRAWLAREGDKADTRKLRVLRGGSWFGSPKLCRSACRFRDHPNNRSGNLGFRVACDPPRTLEIEN